MSKNEEWGVMFNDGSVLHPWNGRTQREQAEKHQRQYREELAPDNIRLAHRPNRHSAWEVVPDE